MKLTELVTGLQHIGIFLGDIEGGIAFYEKLGFELTNRRDPQYKPALAFLQLKNICIELVQVDNPPAPTAGPIDHITIDVSDIEKTFEIVKGLGVKMDAEITTLADVLGGGVRYFFIEGVVGERIEFNQML